jgi:hypothetical protein
MRLGKLKVVKERQRAKRQAGSGAAVRINRLAHQ